MLKVSNCAVPTFPENFIAEYGIPLKIRWGPWVPLDYWSVGHPKYSLIEFGLERKSGLLRSITIVSPHKVVKNSELSFPNPKTTEAGMPVCKIYDENSHTSNYSYVEETYDFEIHLYDENKICVIVYPFKKISSWISSGRVRFGLSQDRSVCLLFVENLSQAEKYHINTTIDTILEQRLKGGVSRR